MSDTRPDIISALNRSGSGIELKSLVSGLVEAETSGQRSLTQRRVEDTNTTISAMGQLSQEVGFFRDGMSRAAETASRSAGSSSSAVSIDVTNEATAKDISAAIDVQELASPQVLTFQFECHFSRVHFPRHPGLDQPTHGRSQCECRHSWRAGGRDKRRRRPDRILA